MHLDQFALGFATCYALLLIGTHITRWHRRRKASKQRTTNPAQPTYTPRAPRDPTPIPNDTEQLLGAYEEALIASTQHSYARTTTSADEAAHFHDATALHAEVRRLRLAVSDRINKTL